MLDFSKLEQYKENNRIEAKRALGGLPHSIWETYSAFANTMGGVILLGVDEHHDKSLHPVDLPDPEGMAAELTALLNDGHTVSKNILSPNDIIIQTVDGKRTVTVNVPRAARTDRPIYLNGDETLCYRRNGEGDYKCTAEQISAMRRDAERKTQDMRLCRELDLSVINRESFVCFRSMMLKDNPISDDELLNWIGAAADDNGVLRPTVAGLLMFSSTAVIQKLFPCFSLEYYDGNTSFGTQSGFNGNLFEFYLLSCRALAAKAAALTRSPDILANLCIAFREALVNSVVNADYLSPRCVSVKLKDEGLVFSNSGGFRIAPDEALAGGTSDPRNEALCEMFNLISIGKRTGSGIPSIYQLWKKQGFSSPSIREKFHPERISFILPLGNTQSTHSAFSRKLSSESALLMATAISFLTENISANSAEIAQLLGIEAEKCEAMLSQGVASGILCLDPDGSYRLKA